MNTILDNHSIGKQTEMPVLFIGHGSPMNAVEKNEFSLKWKAIADSIPKPEAILCISAHWETKGSFVTAMKNPPTIHDFSGFPRKLHEVEYPSLGNPSLAKQISALIPNQAIGMDHSWGLDHGTWSILVHMYPEADIPVLQLSMDTRLSAREHYRLAKYLNDLRRQKILIVGSGNIVHNLRLVSWNNPDSGYDWALEANTIFKDLIQKRDHESLMDYKKLGHAIQMAIPTPEHYLPLLYILALTENEETIRLFNDKTIMGSLSMTSLCIG